MIISTFLGINHSILMNVIQLHVHIHHSIYCTSKISKCTLLRVNCALIKVEFLIDYPHLYLKFLFEFYIQIKEKDTFKCI